MKLNVQWVKNWHDHFQRGPLTSDLKISEWKLVLWVPTSLLFTYTPSLPSFWGRKPSSYFHLSKMVIHKQCWNCIQWMWYDKLIVRFHSYVVNHFNVTYTLDLFISPKIPWPPPYTPLKNGWSDKRWRHTNPHLEYVKAGLFGICIPTVWSTDVPFLIVGYLKKEEVKGGQGSTSIKNVFCLKQLSVCLLGWPPLLVSLPWDVNRTMTTVPYLHSASGGTVWLELWDFYLEVNPTQQCWQCQRGADSTDSTTVIGCVVFV